MTDSNDSDKDDTGNGTGSDGGRAGSGDKTLHRNLAEIEKALAKLDPMVYEQQRKPLAAELGFRVATLDETYKHARKGVAEQKAREFLEKTRGLAEATAEHLGIGDIVVPKPYVLDESGVSYIAEPKSGDVEPEQIYLTRTAAWVEAAARDRDSENWGMSIIWLDRDNKKHNRTMPAELLHDHQNLSRVLELLGLSIVPGKELEFAKYIAAFTTSERIRSATHLGWYDNSFVLPGDIIHPPKKENISFQPTEYHASYDSVFASDRLDEWKSNIADPLSHCDLAVVVLSVSLAAPFATMADVENGGINLYGRTSKGKTILLQVGASAWGNGADPAVSSNGNCYIQRWYSTKNGLEGVFQSFNDLLLCLDEIGESDLHDFGKQIYQALSGIGKSRADVDGSLKTRRHWGATILSTGELPVQQVIEESGGKVRGGQLVRFIDIAVAQYFDSQAEAENMKKAAGRYFGTAGPAFIRYVTDIGLDEIRTDFQNLENTTKEIGDAPTPEAGRVRKRFAFYAMIGELAIEAEILPWETGRVLDACRAVYQTWLKTCTTFTDAQRGVLNVKNFIMAHGSSRFEHDKDTEGLVKGANLIARPIINRVGWYRNDRYCFSPEGFREACDGVLDTTVKHALEDLNLLTTVKDKKFLDAISVDGVTTSVVAVKKEILESTGASLRGLSL